MKRGLFGAVFSLTLIALLAIGWLGCKKKEEVELVKIGAILPLTGDGASLGQDCKNGIELAAMEFNARGKLRVKVLYEDSQGNPEKAVNAYRKLVDGGIKVIIGDLFSAPTLAIAPLTERDRVFVFSPGASSPKLSGASRYVFRNYPSDNYEGELIARYAIEQGFKNISIIYPINDYGVGLREVFVKTYQELGGGILVDEGYTENTTDFRSILVKVQTAPTKSDALYLPGYYAAIGRIAVQTKELGFQIQMLSNVGVEDPKIFEIAGNSINGLIYTAPAVDLSSPDSNIVNFVKSYRKIFNKEPGFPAAHGYDTGQILFSLLSEKENDAEFLRNKILSGRFVGVTGHIVFKSNGDVEKEFSLKKVVDGQFINIGIIK